MNGRENDSFFNFLQDNNNLEYTTTYNKRTGKNKYFISIARVEQYDVNYYIKVIDKDIKISGEKEDTLAILEFERYYI